MILRRLTLNLPYNCWVVLALKTLLISAQVCALSTFFFETMGSIRVVRFLANGFLFKYFLKMLNNLKNYMFIYLILEAETK